MKRLLVLLALVFGLGQAFGAITATVTNSNVGVSSATTLTLTLAGTNASELVVVGTTCYDATATITAAITGEGAMTAVGSVNRNVTFSNAAQQLFYYPVLASGGSKTVTFTYTNTCFAEAVGGSFAGATGTPFDVQNQASTGGTTSVTTTVASDMIFGLATNSTTPVTPTDDGGYTAIAFTSNVQAGKGFYNLNVGAAVLHSVTSSGAISIAAFKAAAGGAIGSRAALTGAGK